MRGESFSELFVTHLPNNADLFALPPSLPPPLSPTLSLPPLPLSLSLNCIPTLATFKVSASFSHVESEIQIAYRGDKERITI